MNDEKFVEGLERMRPYLTKFANSLFTGGSVSYFDGDDLVQETMIRAFKGRGTFNCKDSYFEKGLSAWIIKIMINCFIALKRRKGLASDSRTESLDLLFENGVEIIDTRCSIEDKVVYDDIIRKLLLADHSGDETGNVGLFFNKFFNGVSYLELAGYFEIPIGTVKSRIHRGRNYLRSVYHSL